MNTLYAVILGLVQGFTEFLPVSSSGHLVLLENIFGIKNDTIFFDVMLHVGTLLAVCIFYRKTIIKIIKNPFGKLTWQIIVASIPTVIIAILFKDFFTSAFSGEYLVCGFLVTCIFLIVMTVLQSKYQMNGKINLLNAFVTGIFQGIAIMPGISRSGATITSCVVQGINKEEGTEFSFLLSAPVIFGSMAMELVKINKSGETLSIGIGYLIIGVITSFLSGLVAIKSMNNIVKRNNYYIFVIYLLCLSALIIILNNLMII